MKKPAGLGADPNAGHRAFPTNIQNSRTQQAFAIIASAIADKMDSEEVDSWYEEEKQKSMDDYAKDIDDGKDKKQALEIYDKRIQSLIAKYNKLMDLKLDNKKKGRFYEIISKLKERIILFRK